MKNLQRNPVDYYDTFIDLMDGFLKKHPKDPAITEYGRFGDQKDYTYEDMATDALDIAEALRFEGYEDTRFAILSENSYQWLISYFGIAAGKNVAVCIDTEQSDEVILDMLAYVEPRAVFCSEQFFELAKEFVAKRDVKIVLMNAEVEGYLTLDQIVGHGREKRLSGKGVLRTLSVQPEDDAVIAYTSGTSSEPKAVVLSQRGVLWNAADGMSHLKTEQRCFIALPFYHTYSMGCMLISMLHGAHITINGNMKTLFRDLTTCRPEAMAAVPLMIEALYNQLWITAEKNGKKEAMRKLIDRNLKLKKIGIKIGLDHLVKAKEAIIGPLHYVTSGGAHISKQICEELDLFGIRIIQGYGVTECAPIVALNGNHFCRFESVGQLIPHVEVKIVEEEIWVKGPCVMKGYFKNEALTKEAMEDGWFKTGDLGYFDSQNYLHLTGRKKELIVFKNGKKILPQVIEEKIYKIPLVKEVVLYGTAIGDDRDEVKLAASIYPDPALTAHMESFEILERINMEIDKLNQGMPFYQKIQLVTLRKTPFEKTSQGKIKRNS